MTESVQAKTEAEDNGDYVAPTDPVIELARKQLATLTDIEREQAMAGTPIVERGE